MRLCSLLVLTALATACNNDKPPEGDISVDTVLSPDVRGVDEPFGRACTNVGKACPDKDPAGFELVCIGLQGGSAGKGFCARTCTDVGGECFGVPNGQQAGCFISANTGDAGGGGDKYCGFICKTKESSWACPGTLTCGKTDKDGTAFCLP